MKTEVIDTLCSNHSEAYTKICFHTIYASENLNAGNIMIHASDTDIAVIMTHHAQKCCCTIWMLVGKASKKQYEVSKPNRDFSLPWTQLM